jgi:hypothetical protein
MLASASSLLDYWPLPLAVVGLIFLGLGASYLKSRQGWRRFAELYAVTAKPRGRAYYVPIAEFGTLAPYRNSVFVTFAEQGVYFAREFPLGLFHRPFLVPWESVLRVEKKDGFVMGPHFLVDVKDVAAGHIHLWLPGKVEKELQRYFPPMLESPPPSARPQMEGQGGTGVDTGA